MMEKTGPAGSRSRWDAAVFDQCAAVDGRTLVWPPAAGTGVPCGLIEREQEGDRTERLLGEGK